MTKHIFRTKNCVMRNNLFLGNSVKTDTDTAEDNASNNIVGIINGSAIMGNMSNPLHKTIPGGELLSSLNFNKSPQPRKKIDDLNKNIRFSF